MSLSFLAKKTWHTQRTDNVEQVWLAEQKKEKEEKKLKELQKQIDEERQIEELRTLQKDAGLVTDPKQKLEWMYEGPGSAVASEAQAREYKLGKAYEPTKQSEEMSQLENKNVAGSTWLDNTSSNENELFSRLNQDPLYAMRQSQKRDREQKVLQNPLAMKRLRASLRDELTAYEQKRAVRKAAKKAKKAEKKRRKKEKKKRKRASPSSSPSRSRSRSCSRSRSPRRRSPSPRRRSPSPPHQKRDGYGLRKGRVDDSRGPRNLGPDRGAVAAREREAAERRRRPQREQLTDEEKARRLAEFASDGAAHDGRRAERLRHHRGNEAKDSIAEDDAELARRAASRQGHDAAFLRDTRARAYVGSETSLADNVGRNRNRLDRRSRGDDA